MRPRWPGRRMIWFRPKVVTPSARRSETKRSSRVGLERGVADAGVHACMMPTHVSASSGVQPAVVALEAQLARRMRLQPRHPARGGEDADVGQAGAQARAGVGEQLRREPDLGPLAQRARVSSPTTVSGSSTCRKQSRAEPGRAVAQVLDQRRPCASRKSIAPTSICPWSAVTTRKCRGRARARPAPRAPRRRTRRSTARGGARWRRSRPSRGTSARAGAEPRGRLLEALVRNDVRARERRRAVLAAARSPAAAAPARARRAARRTSGRARSLAGRA